MTRNIRTVRIIRPVRGQRPLTQPMASVMPVTQQQCSNHVDAKFDYEHPDKIYRYHYQRAARDGSKRGELRLHITDEAMAKFQSSRTLATLLVAQGLVNLTKKEGGWWLCTGAHLPKWDEQTASFHDALGVWLRAFNTFWLPAETPTAEVVQKVRQALPVAKTAGGTLKIARPQASNDQLQALALKFKK